MSNQVPYKRILLLCSQMIAMAFLLNADISRRGLLIALGYALLAGAIEIYLLLGKSKQKQEIEETVAVKVEPVPSLEDTAPLEYADEENIFDTLFVDKMQQLDEERDFAKQARKPVNLPTLESLPDLTEVEVEEVPYVNDELQEVEESPEDLEK